MLLKFPTTTLVVLASLSLNAQVPPPLNQNWRNHRLVGLEFYADKTITTRNYSCPVRPTGGCDADLLTTSLLLQLYNSAPATAMMNGKTIYQLGSSADVLSWVQNSLSTDSLLFDIQLFDAASLFLTVESMMESNNVQWRSYAFIAPTAGHYTISTSLKGSIVKPCNIVKISDSKGNILNSGSTDVVLSSDATRAWELDLTKPGYYHVVVGLGSGSVHFASAGSLDGVCLNDSIPRTWTLRGFLAQQYLVPISNICQVGNTATISATFNPQDHQITDPQGVIQYNNIAPGFCSTPFEEDSIEIDTPIYTSKPTNAMLKFDVQTWQSDFSKIGNVAWDGSKASIAIKRESDVPIHIEFDYPNVIYSPR